MIQITFIIVKRKLRAREVKWLVIQLSSEKRRITPWWSSATQPTSLSGWVQEMREQEKSAYAQQVHIIKPQQSGGSLPFKLNSLHKWTWRDIRDEDNVLWVLADINQPAQVVGTRLAAFVNFCGCKIFHRGRFQVTILMSWNSSWKEKYTISSHELVRAGSSIPLEFLRSLNHLSWRMIWLSAS